MEDSRARSRAWPGLLWVFASVVFCLLWMRLLPVVRIQLNNGVALIAWLRPALRAWRWPLVLVSLFLSAVAWWGTTRAIRGGGWWSRRLGVARPLVLLPLSSPFIFLCDLLPRGVTALVFLAVAGPIAAVILNVYEALADVRPWRPKEWTLFIFVISVLGYSLLGYHLAERTGEHVGDEAHYLTQARSLYEDGDLDVRNEIMEKAERKPPAGFERRHTHISDASRGEHWYSYHPYGLPLIMAPFWGWGMGFRYLLLAVIAALGNVGVYKLCRSVGAGRGASGFLVLTLGASFPWAIYSARALPEMLGAALLVWVFWSVVNQSRRPWLSVLVGSLCSGYMIMSHERFIPISLMGFGFYGLFGLFGSESWPRKIVRLGVFTLLSFGMYGLYAASQFLLFENGMKLPVGGVVFGYPLGLLGVIADGRGIMIVLPAFMWLAASLPLWIAADREHRWFGGCISVTVAVCLIFSCTNSFFQGGSCVPGRYLFTIVPLLVPGAAIVFERSSRLGRWWYVFLALVSVQLLVLTLVALPQIGRGFILPVQYTKRVYPLLSGLFHGYANFRLPSGDCVWSSVFVLAGVVLTAAVIRMPRRWAPVAVVCLLAIAVAGAVAHSAQRDNRPRVCGMKTKNAVKYLGRFDTDRFLVRVENDTASLESLLKVRFKDTQLGGEHLTLTTEDLGVTQKGMRFSQPRVDRNDWTGRPLRWLTLTRPFAPIGGEQLIGISGTLTGDASLQLAIREGARTLVEKEIFRGAGALDAEIRFTCRGNRGDLYFLVRLADGEGAFELADLYWMPVWDSGEACE